MGVQQILTTLDRGAIQPTYRANLEWILNGWIQAFQPHEQAFGNLTAFISRENVLFLRCAVISTTSSQAQFPISIEIRIPPRFPEVDPQCKLVHRETGQIFPRGALPPLSSHPAISSLDYTIDLPKLASSSASTQNNLPLTSKKTGTPSLVQLVMVISSVINDLLEQYQMQQQPPPPPPSQPFVAPAGNPQTTNVFGTSSSPVITTTTNVTSQFSQQQQQQNNPNSSGSVRLGPPLKASPQVYEATTNRVKEFLEQREAALKVLGHLQGSEETLQKLTKSLNDKKSTLESALTEVSSMQQLCDKVVQAKPSSALKCIEASDELSAQGFSLLAEVQACDDVMDALEKRLRPRRGGGGGGISGGTSIIGGGTTPSSVMSSSVSAAGDNYYTNTSNAMNETPTTEYLRAVANIARKQFMAKFLLRKVQGKRLAPRSLQSLSQRFPSLDASVIRAVLESNAYDAAATAQRLTEMTKS